MNNLIFRDKKKRILYKTYELERIALKSLCNDLRISKEVRYTLATILNAFPRNSSKIRIKNRCILTGRSHSILRLCKISRIKFRELASQGLLMGITKASW